MNRTVVWLEAALAQLGLAFVPLYGTAEGRAITEAMATLEPELETRAHLLGESRNGNVRVAFEAPLSIDFEIHDDHKLVIVTAIRHRPPKQS
jgi:hypothetical protein